MMDLSFTGLSCESECTLGLALSNLQDGTISNGTMEVHVINKFCLSSLECSAIESSSILSDYVDTVRDNVGMFLGNQLCYSNTVSLHCSLQSVCCCISFEKWVSLFFCHKEPDFAHECVGVLDRSTRQ